METKKQFIVTEHPPWYFNSNHADVFGCESSQGLFDEVVNLMTLSQEKVSESEKGFKPKTIYKTIRSMVIGEAGTIQQKPTRSLLLALMDLVDIEGGNDFELMPRVDKAGLKHILLAYGNHTSFYVPKQALTSTDGKKVIPVLTQYSEKHNFMYYDSNRSMIGTYTVVFPATRKDAGDSYFVQEVLFVPGFESLKLLKRVTGNKFDFWDMALEVPTHLTALTATFQEIQLFQLLRSQAPASAPGENDTLLSARTEKIDPMCCVLGTDSGDMLKKRRETSVDCFTESQVVCNLKHFRYPNGGTRTVYCRRKAKLQNGKRVFLAPVVNLRKDQVPVPELYVSTTLRFCRAVKHCVVKGNGESVSYWNETLEDLKRDTFLTGTNMYEEIYQTALVAFIRRVNPNSWCNYIPKHVENMMDPVMVEVVELAIKFMDSGIPNAFAVAELLYCPIEKVQKCLKCWIMHVSDKAIRETTRRKRISIVEEQMRTNWTELSQIALSYAQQRYKGDSKMVAACEDLFKHGALESVAKAQKKWQALVKHDSSKIKDKALTRQYAKAKVLFLKLRVCCHKLKKRLRAVKGELDGEHGTSLKAQNADASALAKVKGPREDEDAVGADMLSIITPEFVPISSWIKNMSTLLLSEPWLNDNNLRREAVCTLLGLDGTLLNRKCRDVLSDWVIDNRSVVRILENYGLQDRLSKALVDCLRSTSTDNWRRKILLSFGGAKSQPRSPQCIELLRKPSKKSDELSLLGKRVCKHAEKQHVKVVKSDGSGSVPRSSVSPSASSTFRKARNSRAHRPQRNNFWLSGAQEVNSEEESHGDEEEQVLGEDLQSTENYDNAEKLDEYDYDTDFIDDNPIEDRYSPSEEEESEEERSTERGGAKYKVWRKKRAAQFSSGEESTKPEVKRIKPTKGKRRRTGERHSVSAPSAEDEIQAARKKEDKRRKTAKVGERKRTFRESKRTAGEEKWRGGTKRTPFKRIYSPVSDTDFELEEKSTACRAKSAENKQLSNLNSGKLSDFETEGEEKRRQDTRRVTSDNCSNITKIDSEFEERQDRSDDTPRCEEPTGEQRDAEKKEFGIHCKALQSHGQRLSQEEEKVSKINQRDVYQEEAERLDIHSYSPAELASAAFYPNDDSDHESYCQRTLDKRVKGTGSRRREIDYTILM